MPKFESEDVAKNERNRSDRAGDRHTDGRNGTDVHLVGWFHFDRSGVGRFFGGGGEASVAGGFGGGGALRDLFLNHAEEFFVG